MNGTFVTIKEASEMLGVSKLTLRNWDNSGKLSAYRHPISNYRVYKREALDALIAKMESGARPIREDKSRVRKLVVKQLDD
ncbi:MAG: hypothetical protein COV91_00770 [Candidatus Taylorbacteria bacterium CG11_big_fil_rev_8_21_14_0_20_46_11]|uniref:HTH merR-type domain-containing protein n=1 Tax=Candidatus Taylorbacteria bacterium CG11_big_fil_rev_8_21_14_0_20_46_11 TaxID=1975025 RepID=A0A2H0KCM0_9BACT|nr:MAG: hypothetical protein COV91_00770 [Candidatus Taylorbacteria bacterium CG11_big_fil_rev_8_21_14_0_20_46_11]